MHLGLKRSWFLRQHCSIFERVRKATRNWVTGYEEHTFSIFRAHVRRVRSSMRPVMTRRRWSHVLANRKERFSGEYIGRLGQDKEKQDRKLTHRMKIQGNSKEFAPSKWHL